MEDASPFDFQIPHPNFLEPTMAEVRQFYMDFTPSDPSIFYSAILERRGGMDGVVPGSTSAILDEKSECITRLVTKMQKAYGTGKLRFVLDLYDSEVFGPRVIHVMSAFMIDMEDLYPDPPDWKIVRCDANWQDKKWGWIDCWIEDDPRPTGDVSGSDVTLLGFDNNRVKIEVKGCMDTFLMATEYEVYYWDTGYRKSENEKDEERLREMLSKLLTKEERKAFYSMNPCAKVEHCLKYDQVLVTADAKVATYALSRGVAFMYIDYDEQAWYDIWGIAGGSRMVNNLR